MAVGDFYEITLFQRTQEQQIINRWHYEQTIGVAGAAASLRDGFQSIVVAALAPIQSTNIAYERVLVQNLTNPADNSEDVTVTPASGSSPSLATPLMLAFVFRSARPDLSKRYSYKRFCAVAEDLLVGPTFAIGGAPVAALQTAMAAAIPFGPNSWKPVQLKFVYPPGGGSPTITKNYDITSWNARSQPGSQDTRRLGSGA